MIIFLYLIQALCFVFLWTLRRPWYTLVAGYLFIYFILFKNGKHLQRFQQLGHFLYYIISYLECVIIIFCYMLGLCKNQV